MTSREGGKHVLGILVARSALPSVLERSLRLAPVYDGAWVCLVHIGGWKEVDHGSAGAPGIGGVRLHRPVKIERTRRRRSSLRGIGKTGGTWVMALRRQTGSQILEEAVSLGWRGCVEVGETGRGSQPLVCGNGGRTWKIVDGWLAT